MSHSKNQEIALQRGAEKVAKIPVKVVPTEKPLRKPAWIRIKAANSAAINGLKATLRKHHLHTVCEEASCPNLNECFAGGTATFMIMGKVCTRRCPFCDVAHGRPAPLDNDEPLNLAQTVAAMRLNYVVITSVNRDDLPDGGAGHFVACVKAVHEQCPTTQIEILVPDFRGRVEAALARLGQNLPTIFNHNLETVPRLYPQARPGADYQGSLQLLKQFKAKYPTVLTKSGLMLGLGEEIEEILAVMQDLRAHDCEMLTLGQYLQPTRYHLPVQRYLAPSEFEQLAQQGYEMGFKNVASAPLVRSSYHAERQSLMVNGEL
jgi:lipoic acid synthetase